MSEGTPQSRAQGSRADRFKFRRRGLAVSRLEGFSDAVFAFALTLLVVSLQAAQTFDELLATLSGILPFVLSFTLFIFIWYQRHTFFRRYGLEAAMNLRING